jgi:hypothetical protein
MRTSVLLSICSLSVCASPVLAESAFQTPSTLLALNCTPGYATAHDTRDPIRNIRIRLTEDGTSIVHEAESGAAYNRTDQYFQEDAQWSGKNFTWRGVSATNPNIEMTGKIEFSPNGYVYREVQFDQARGGRQIYEMVSSCTTQRADLSPPKEGRSATPPVLPATPAPRPAAPSALPSADVQRVIDAMSARLFDCVEPKLADLVKSGEMAAALADAALTFCKDEADGVISAQALQGGAQADRQALRTSLRADVLARAVQARADAKESQ